MQHAPFRSTAHPWLIGILLGLVLLGSSIPASGQDQPAPSPDHPDHSDHSDHADHAAAHPSFPHLLVVDLRDVLGAPLTWNQRQWGLFGLSVAGVGVAALADGSIRDHEARDHNHLADQVARIAESFGAEDAVGVIGAFYVAGLVTDNPRTRMVAEDSAAASLLSGVIVVPVLKYATGRRRPRDTARTFDFQPFSGSSSFPSGHAAEAFTVASVVASEYDSPWIKGASYGTATLVAFARVHHNAHFASDVTAGAILGTFVGHSVVRVNRRERSERGRLALTPISGEHGEPGLGVALSF